MKMFEDFTVAVSRQRQVYQRRGRWRGSPCCRTRRPSASIGPTQPADTSATMTYISDATRNTIRVQYCL